MWNDYLARDGYTITWKNLEKGGSDKSILKNFIRDYKDGTGTAEEGARSNNITVEEFLKYVEEYNDEKNK